MSSEIHSETLPNGLRLLLRPLRVAPVAEIQFWVRVGSADERDDERGLAHFHEHMLFKGTETRGVGEIAGAIEGAGGRINAFTSFDITCYHATLPSDAAAVGFDVLADALRNSVFDAEEVAREVLVVREEIRRSADDPQHLLSDALFATVFDKHPYGLPILGTHESVARINRERVRAFYRRWYTPEQMALVVVGDFDPDEMRARAQRLGDTPRGSATRQRKAEPRQRAPRVRLLERPFERASLDLSWPAVPLAHADAPLFDLLAFILGDGESARLQRRVKEELGLVDRIDASCYLPFDPGLFGVTLDCASERATAAVEQVAREVELLRREPVKKEELEKAQRNFIISRAWERESVSGMAHKLGSSLMLTGDPLYEERYLERVREAQPEELQRVASEWLAPERANLAMVLPSTQSAKLNAEDAQSAIERGRAGAAKLFEAPRKQAPCGELQAFTLDNGLRIFVQPRRDIPVVAARAVLLGGQLVEDEKSAGLSSFLAGMWLRGTERRSAADFATQVESLAADVNSFSGRNSCGVTLDCSSDQVQPVLDLFAEAIRSPVFAESEIERERRETLAALARREDHLSARALDLFTRTHYKAHPYRHPVAGTKETVERFTRAELEALQARLVCADNLVIALVGDLDPERAATEVARRFAELEPGARIEAALPPVEPTPREARQQIEKRERAQAHLLLGFRGLDLLDPDRAALEVLSQVLGGQGGRLFLELRDRRSLAYAVNATNVEGVAPGFFAVYIGTSAERFDEAQAGIREELERVRQAAPTAAELERARRYLIGQHAIRQQRSATRALQIALDARYGLAPDAEARYPERIAAVSGEDLLRVAQRVIHLERATLAAIRP